MSRNGRVYLKLSMKNLKVRSPSTICMTMITHLYKNFQQWILTLLLNITLNQLISNKLKKKTY